MLLMQLHHAAAAAAAGAVACAIMRVYFTPVCVDDHSLNVASPPFSICTSALVNPSSHFHHQPRDYAVVYYTSLLSCTLYFRANKDVSSTLFFSTCPRYLNASSN